MLMNWNIQDPPNKDAPHRQAGTLVSSGFTQQWYRRNRRHIDAEYYLRQNCHYHYMCLCCR